jgi:DNA-nicking Smr family endonuclease
VAGSRRRSDGFANPFKQLKGFRVFPPEVAPQPKINVSAEPLAEEAGDLFAREMKRLGVQGGAAPSPEIPQGTDTAVPCEPDDNELFLDAVGQLDAVFEDERSAATPRRMKLVRRGRLVPEASLDLHGLTRDEARARTRHFLENAAYHGQRTVLIITGRGKGSGGEPVLRGELERYLSQEGRAWVSEWGRAPRQYGGEGALVVFLKG